MQKPLTLLALLPIVLLALYGRASAGVSVAYDFVDRYSEGKVANALSSSVTTARAVGVPKRSIGLHPLQTGDATMTFKVSLPKTAKGEALLLMCSAGISHGIKTDDPANPFNGVTFALKLDGKTLFEADLNEPKWVDGALDLASKAGKTVEVVFVTNAKKNSNYDWAMWGEPRILKLSANLLDTSGRARAANGIVTAKATGDGASLKVVPIDAQGRELSEGETIGLAKDRLSAARFDLAALGATSVRIAAVGKAKDLAVYKFDPALEIVSFGPTQALVPSGKPVEFRCVIKNIGEGMLDAEMGGRAVLSTAEIPDPGAGMSEPPGLEGKSEAAADLGTMLPGEEKTITWPVIQPPGPAFAARVTLTGQGLRETSSAWWGAVSAMPEFPAEAPTKAESSQLADGTIVLQNPAVRIAFVKGKTGYTGWILSLSKGGAWEQAATGPLGKVIIAGKADAKPVVYQLYPEDAKLGDDGGKPTVAFSTARDIGSAPCRFEWKYTLADGEVRISAVHAMTADAPVEIVHFSGPMVYAGDGSFGSAKDEGLFPGLEYLLSERSSGTDNASPPYNLRTVPHPNKVTIPFMAVRSGDKLVALEWDPLQKWAPKADRPAAVFASPNFIDGQDNHKMGVFAPSVPGFAPENGLIAHTPYILEAGKSIQLAADIFARSDCKSVLDAQDMWLARHGVPEPPDPKITPREIMELCDSAYLESAWDGKLLGWKHTNTGPVSFYPMVATYLWHRGNILRDEGYRKKIFDVVTPAVEKARGSLDLDMALLVGGVQDALTRMADSAKGMIAAQREDDSWAFTPDEKHKILGRPGDSSSGWSANYAASVLRYALVSGDAKAGEAGLKALAWLDTQTRPEGAQTWELQLHVPDILAAARLVNAYVYGYQLTGDQKYLDKAIYWAKSGLPFVYMWNAPDRPIMRYGTIPVFGVTWFDGSPWFGVCVQWNGLEYAYSIARLSDYDKNFPWMKVAEGILNCAVQQQLYTRDKYPENKGMYPDAYSVVKGEEQYHWDLNPALISRLLLRKIGVDGFAYTYTVKDQYGNTLAVTAPAQGGEILYRPDWLTLKFRYGRFGPPATVYLVLAGVYNPYSVGSHGREIFAASNLDEVKQGWVYVPETTTAIIKLETGANEDILIDLIHHETHYAVIKAAKEEQEKKAE